jgi:hypothetical protein
VEEANEALKLKMSAFISGVCAVERAKLFGFQTLNCHFSLLCFSLLYMVYQPPVQVAVPTSDH